MRRKREYDFVVTVKHPDYFFYNIISSLLCLMTVTAEIFGLLNSAFTTIAWIKIVLIAFVIIYLLVSFLYFNKKKYVLSFRWPLFASAVLWFFLPLNNAFLGLFYLVAAVVEGQLKFPQEIGFAEEEVVFNNFPARHYTWKDIQNVVLKDNIITIDFKNNKIFQKETETETSPEIEKEFNGFCEQHLAAALLS